MRGSKYSQSNIIGVFKKCKEILSSEQTKNRLLLFSGTPCQIHGLKSFLIHDYKNLITVDIVCHSTPSPMVFEDYIKFVNNHFDDRLTNLQMRYKQKMDGASNILIGMYLKVVCLMLTPKGCLIGGQFIFLM